MRYIIALVALMVIASGCMTGLAKGGLKGKPDAPSEAIKPECSDRIDNDGDGYCDTIATRKCKDGSIPGDKDCSDYNDMYECKVSAEVCDGVDNDCDGDVDETCTSCHDSDGFDPYISGTTIYGEYYNDTCLNENTVLEYTCGTYGLRNTSIVCDSGVCENGACLNCTQEVCDGSDNDCDGIVDEDCDTCTDSDGFDPYVFGVVYNTFGNATDFCINNMTVMERTCGNGAVVNTSYYCNNTICDSGACQELCVPTLELCDGIDNDCDLVVDEGC